MLPRFYVPSPRSCRWRDARAATRRKPHHLTRVMRLGAGDEIAVFDGRGHEFRAQVTSAARGKVRIQLIERLSLRRRLGSRSRSSRRCSKGDKMDDVVRDATMMGVAAIEPVVTARTIVRVQRADGKRSMGTRQPSRPPSSAAERSSRRSRRLGVSTSGYRRAPTDCG